MIYCSLLKDGLSHRCSFVPQHVGWAWLSSWHRRLQDLLRLAHINYKLNPLAEQMKGEHYVLLSWSGDLKSKRKRFFLFLKTTEVRCFHGCTQPIALQQVNKHSHSLVTINILLDTLCLVHCWCHQKITLGRSNASWIKRFRKNSSPY